MEYVNGLWRRVSGHEGDLLRAAARIYGTSGVLRARADRYEAETTAWVAKFQAYKQALHQAGAQSTGGAPLPSAAAA